MNDLLKFMINLLIVAALLGGGGWMLIASFDHQSGVLFWTSLVLLFVGFIRGVWLCISNGVSPFGD